MNSRSDLALEGLKAACGAVFGWLIATNTHKILSLIPTTVFALALGYQFLIVPRRRILTVRDICKSFMSLAEFDAKTRLTLHRPISRGRYQQVFDYLPNGAGARRKFPRSEGIVGKCINEPGVLIQNFADDHDYEISMVEDYGYSVETSRRRSTDRRSYFAAPILDGKRVVAVLYLDSVTQGAFPNHKKLGIEMLMDDILRQIGELLPHWHERSRN